MNTVFTTSSHFVLSKRLDSKLDGIYLMDFKNVKKQILEASDLSKKGSIDEHVCELVDYINQLDDYVTTSSCSGRAILYTVSSGCITERKKSKKNCKWLYISHDLIDPEEFISNVNPIDGDLLFKFQPFILHVQCSNLEKAKLLHTVALAAGFRESGLTIGKHGKITLAIRSNLMLELPLSQDNVMLVSNIYLKFLVEQANEKMDRNQRNIKDFLVVLKKSFGSREETEKNSFYKERKISPNKKEKVSHNKEEKT